MAIMRAKCWVKASHNQLGREFELGSDSTDVGPVAFQRPSVVEAKNPRWPRVMRVLKQYVPVLVRTHQHETDVDAYSV
jgi:hypothetical protein